MYDGCMKIRGIRNITPIPVPFFILTKPTSLKSNIKRGATSVRGVKYSNFCES